MERERTVNRFAKLFFWEDILRKQFSQMNIEFVEIVLIEELIPFTMYSGFSRIKSLSEKDEFIEIIVTFNKKGLPNINCNRTIIHSIEDCLDGGKIIFTSLNKLIKY
jgi:hypothetical protein